MEGGQKAPGEKPKSTSREQSSSQLNSPYQETQTTLAAFPAWHWGNHFFWSTFLLLLSLRAPGWYLQVSCHWLTKIG